ncbi:MAG TPA: hypothetical protein VF746_10935 [Longimicrobium sp.]
MTRRLLPALAAAALALALAQCRGSVDPPELTGLFVVESLNGTPLPATWVQGAWGRQEVLADTFWLFADGTGVEHVVERYVTTPPTVPDTRRRESRFAYTLGADGAIEIGYECNDTGGTQASCAPPPHLAGQVSESGMRLTWVVGLPQVLVLRRVQ